MDDDGEWTPATSVVDGAEPAARPATVPLTAQRSTGSAGMPDWVAELDEADVVKWQKLRKMGAEVVDCTGGTGTESLLY